MGPNILPRDWFASESAWVRANAEAHYYRTRPQPARRRWLQALHSLMTSCAT